MALACAGALAAAPTQAAPQAPAACQGTIYLTFDTGSQSQAGLIAETLKRHHAKATFFLANEKTVRGDWSLDPSWSAFWKARVAEGHAFGTHTFDHVYWQRDLPGGRMVVKPQFGAHAGQRETWTEAQYCAELKRVDARFVELTGRHLDPFFRAPGGHTSPNVLAAAQQCGYTHFGWPPAGFSGDETPSERFSNAALLQRALDKLRDGDIFMAHMGIWSRKDPYMPANLEPLLAGLERKGYCFATLREHPSVQNK
ncbi:polysaccharide deacetylase family protein [Massilia arenosa]|uniref:Polysaccharide deacetylase family protein n=1 Tax=Zemynaea arenosa TaxID=2561931 RepID=A0A4Y9SMW8_9BURK|nr:polysaccharide deacetylase family protein [Massilia arenosa]TFW23891.1 polysaccharide deacetylase family protein [Massilia arenosa]